MTTEPAVLASDVAGRERVDDRLDRLEGGLVRLESRFEATLPHLATKADVHAAINALTWRFILVGVALSGVVIAAIAAAAAWIKLF